MKKQNLNESGRSMVEMLGVLAIIGVLSVDAVGGYRMAMHRTWLNKSLEVFNNVYNAANIAYTTPNSAMSCCSYDSVSLDGNYFTGCDQNKTDWRSEQLNEMKNLLPADYFGKYFLDQNTIYLKDYSNTMERIIGWSVLNINRAALNKNGVMAISMRLPKPVCVEFVQTIRHNQLYRETMLGFSRHVTTDWNPRTQTDDDGNDTSDEVVRFICDSNSTVGFYFALPHMDMCDTE